MTTRWEDFSYPGSPIKRHITLKDGQIVTRAVQPNIEDCLEQNVRDYNEDSHSGKFWRNPDWTRVASIPLWLLEKWKVEEGIDFMRWNEEDKAKIVAKLNSSDYLKLRTAKGRI